MNPPTAKQRSLAAEASWTALGLAVGCAAIFFVFYLIDQSTRFDRTSQGLLTGIVPRTILYVLWAGEALAVVAGVASFLLIRRNDVTSQAIAGIVARSLCGIATGLGGTVVLWLVVGHSVIGF